MSYVYCLQDKINNICRIGMSTVMNDSRVKTQAAYYPLKLSIHKRNVHDPLFIETYLHKLFKPLRIKASWYKITPDLFYKYVDQVNERGILEQRKWIDNPIKRGSKVWIIKINHIEHPVEFINNYSDVKKYKFKKDGKEFFVIFKGKMDYFSCKAGNMHKVSIRSIKGSKSMDGMLVFRDVEQCDTLVKKYLESIQKEDRHEKFLREKIEKETNFNNK